MTENIGKRLPVSIYHQYGETPRLARLLERASRLENSYSTEITNLERVLKQPNLRGKSRTRRETQLLRLKARLAGINDARSQERPKTSGVVWRGKVY